MVTVTRADGTAGEQVPDIEPDDAEYLAGFDTLEAEAQSLEGGAPGAAPAPAPSTTAADLLGALQLVRVMAKPAFSDWPDFGQVWSDKTLQAMSDSGGAIMDRHGWNLGDLLAQWGPYIGLVAATAPPALATWGHLKHRKALELARRQQGQPAKAPEEAEGVRP